MKKNQAIAPHLLNRPPFKINPGLSAMDTAVDIVNAFNSIETLSGKVSKTFSAILDYLDRERLYPLTVAGYSLAKAFDGAAIIHDMPYHNSQHTCEVMLSAYFISLLGGLDKQETLEIVLAALIHDFQHDGKHNGDIPFRLERKAIHQAKPYLIQAQVTEQQQRYLTALVLATEALSGVNIVRSSYSHHTQGHAVPEIPAAATELEDLLNDPVKSKQALILCEADILPSIGLTFEHALHLHHKLSLEWGTLLELEDKLLFIDHRCRAFVAASFFNSNIEDLRLAILKRLESMPNRK